MILLDKQEKQKITFELEKLSQADRVRDLLFYCKILQEYCAHNKSYRHLYALSYLKVAKEYLGERIDWTEIPIDIDNLELPVFIKSDKKKSIPKCDIDTSDMPIRSLIKNKTRKSGNLPFNPIVR
jgi:hypothetical protein